MESKIQHSVFCYSMVANWLHDTTFVEKNAGLRLYNMCVCVYRLSSQIAWIPLMTKVQNESFSGCWSRMLLNALGFSRKLQLREHMF